MHSHFPGAKQHIKFQMSFLKHANVSFTKFLTICHYTMEANSQGSLKSLSRYVSENYFSHFIKAHFYHFGQSFHFVIVMAFSSSDHGRTFVVMHGATCVETNFGVANAASSEHFCLILATTKQENFPKNILPKSKTAQSL